MAPSLFINFRRRDTGKTAMHLDTGLRNEFGQHEVFRDERSMIAGDHYPAELERNVAGCKALLALVGPRWTSITSAPGRRCIDDEKDWVRREIALALRWRLKVIPVLIDHDCPPKAHELPDDIKDLSMCQAIKFRTAEDALYFPALFDRIRKVVPDLRRTAPRARTGAPGAQSIRTGRITGSAVNIGGSHNDAQVHNHAPDLNEYPEIEDGAEDDEDLW